MQGEGRHWCPVLCMTTGQQRKLLFLLVVVLVGVNCVLYGFMPSVWFTWITISDNTTLVIHTVNTSQSYSMQPLGPLTNLSNCTFWNNTTRAILSVCRGPTTFPNPQLVLFTTMTDSKSKRHIHENTLTLWPALGAQVRPVLFVTRPAQEAHLVQIACASGFHVYVAPLCDHNHLPVLKAMFNVTQTVYPGAAFYGYANGDILFDESLVHTVSLLELYKTKLPPIMAVGRRMDVKVRFTKQQFINGQGLTAYQFSVSLV